MEDNHSLSLFIIFGFSNKMTLKLAIEEKVWIKVTLACGATCRHSSSARPHAGRNAGARAPQKTGEKLLMKIYEESLFCLCKNTMKCVMIRRDHFTLIIRFLEKGAHIVQLETALQQHFGYSSFRSGQKEIIETILSKRDVLGVLPTGGGKSICYQLSGLMLPGLTVVISPLISLMKDQVDTLTQLGIPAAYLNSTI